MKNLLLTLFVLASFAEVVAQSPKQLKIEDVEILNLGDEQTFGRNKSDDTPITGKVRIITGFTTEYIDAEFLDGYATGKWDHYRDKNLYMSVNYVNGYFDGKSIEYYPDGTVFTEIPFAKGQVNGKTTRYYPNGQKGYEQSFVNGTMDGFGRMYSEDGTLLGEENYKLGKPEGKYFSILNRGSSDEYKMTSFYKNGLLSGDYSEIYKNGNIKVQGKYVEGKKEGLWEYGKEDGAKKLTEGYKADELVKKITYYTNGNIDTERNYKNNKEDGVIKQYTLDGKLKTEKTYVAGKQVGKQVQYYSSSTGDYIETSIYSDKGQKEGAYTEMFVDGNHIKSKGQYLKGQKDGKWIYGYKSGSLYKEETYNNGVLLDSKKIEK